MKKKNALLMAVLGTLALCAAGVLAMPDAIELGTGRDGRLIVTDARTVINRYAQLAAPAAPDDDVLLVALMEGFSQGDLVMILQTTGIVPEPPRGEAGPIDLSQDPAGRWELARVATVRPGELWLEKPLRNSYAAQVTQVIRVPEYTDVIVLPGASLVAAPWNGSTGGVLAFLATGTIRNEGELSAKGAGFRGGVASAAEEDPVGCASLPLTARPGSTPGEGIAVLSYGPQVTGPGNASNGGGGGVCPMSGGGGGGNGGPGGSGGDSLAPWDPVQGLGGRGGAKLSYSLADHLTLGGGGGRGYGARRTGAAGGAGGGAIFIRGQQLMGSGVILADGEAGASTEQGGASGGGAGGSILLQIDGAVECGAISSRGGAGGKSAKGSLQQGGNGGAGGGGRVLYHAGRSGACSVIVEAGEGAEETGSAQVGVLQLVRSDGYTLLSQPPRPTILRPQNGAWIRGQTVSIETSTEDAGGVGIEVQIWINSQYRGLADWDAQAGVWVYTHPADGGVLVDAEYNAQALTRFSGPANTTTPSDPITFTVDNTPPVTTIVSKPADPTNQTNAAFTFDAGANIASFTCQLDSADAGDCSDGGITYVGLSEARHDFKVWARDLAGNQEDGGATYSWAIDVTPPTTVIYAAPSDPTTQRNAVFAFRSDGGAVSFSCVLDDAGPLNCSDGGMSYTNLNDGLHLFRVWGRDRAGNEEDGGASHAWRVDTTPPVTTIQSRPDDPTSRTTADFTFTADGGAVAFACQLDSADAGDCSDGGITYSALAEGVHNFRVWARDEVGNTESPGASHQWKVDVTPPVTTITGRPANPTNQTTADFTFVADGGAVAFKCSLDNSAAQDCSDGGIGYTGLGENPNPHRFQVWARDQAGNEEDGGAAYDWVVDRTPPVTTLTRQPDNPTNQLLAQFEFSAVDSRSQVAEYECRKDSDLGSAFTPCGSPYQYTVVEGSHTFDVRARDAAGNWESPIRYSWMVDTTPPVTTINTSPGDPSRFSSATFMFSATGSAVSHECKLGLAPGVPYEDCTVGVVTYNGLQDGIRYTFLVRARDAAGNVENPPKSYAWTVDMTRPDTRILSGPGSPTRNTSATFQFEGTDNDQVTGYECRWDNEGFNPCVTGETRANLEPDTTHTFEVRAQDRAGNKDDVNPAGYTWTIDLTPPVTTIDDGPRDPTNEETAEFTFHATGDPRRFECSRDGTNFTVCTSPVTYAGVGTETQFFYVRATDEAGNVETPVSYSWYVDRTKPVTRILSKPVDPTNELRARFTFDAGGETATFECSRNGADFETCASPVEYDVAPGLQVFSVRATDQAGNQEAAPVSYQWIVDRTPPDTTIVSGPPRRTKNPTATFVFSSPEGSVIYECQLTDNLGGGSSGYNPCTSPVSYPLPRDATYTLRVRARDVAGNSDPSPAVHIWSLDQVKPGVVIERPTQGERVATITPTFRGTSEANSEVVLVIDDNDAGSFSVIAGADGAWSVTNPLSLGNGEHTVKAQATDEAENTGDWVGPRTFTVDVEPPETRIAEKPNDPHGSRLVTFKFESNDPAARFEYSLDDASFVESGALLSLDLSTTGRIDGEHTLQVRARDEAGNIDPTPEKFKWTVLVKPPPSPDVTQPRNGETVFTRTPTVSGKAVPGGSVACSLGDSDKKIGLAEADEQGNWAFRINEEMAEGEYTLRCGVTKAGNPSNERTTVTFSIVAPKPLAQAIGGGLACSGSTATPCLALLGLVAQALCRARRRRR